MTRILLVEDEIALSDPLSFLLEREGYEVVVAADGPSAIAAFDQDGADLVLLDLMLPGLPGTEVCRELRTRPPSRMASSKSSTSMRRRSTARIRASSSRVEYGLVT